MKKVLVVLSAILIASCSVEDGKDGVNGTDGVNGVDGLNGYSSLIVVLEDNSVCPTGGMKVETGLDVNEDGVLNPSEITSTTYICNGQDGTNGSDGADGQDGQNGSDGQDGSDANSNFIFTSEAVSDDSCGEPGGVLFSYGFDTNTNGQLDPSEVVNTALVCNGATGDTGSQGDSGQDGQDGSNGSDGQDGSTGADGSNGYNALVSIDYVEEGELCEFGGISVSFGLDLNLNGELDLDEITGTDITCFTGPIDPTPDPFDVVFHGEWVVYSYKANSTSETTVVSELSDEAALTIDYGVIDLPDSGTVSFNDQDYGWEIFSQSSSDPVQWYRLNVMGYASTSYDMTYFVADYADNNLPETIEFIRPEILNGYQGAIFTLVRKQ